MVPTHIWFIFRVDSCVTNRTIRLPLWGLHCGGRNGLCGSFQFLAHILIAPITVLISETNSGVIIPIWRKMHLHELWNSVFSPKSVYISHGVNGTYVFPSSMIDCQWSGPETHFLIRHSTMITCISCKIYLQYHYQNTLVLLHFEPVSPVLQCPSNNVTQITEEWDNIDTFGCDAVNIFP